ncbi:hypothetical protein SynBIOSE41_04351 [Synechococcus sp. BIOS-E4-1]|nr:hypothetical protein SynBIOSE41_04351 [Synechococcus sp. BIOS-E4-1]
MWAQLITNRKGRSPFDLAIFASHNPEGRERAQPPMKTNINEFFA